ncbi:Hypothetical protein RMHFA_03956 (plasmid) [Roseomonas mucosa]|nr:Hypothetical protein RMHFA_03956 [Roseomonas mucosa]
MLARVHPHVSCWSPATNLTSGGSIFEIGCGHLYPGIPQGVCQNLLERNSPFFGGCQHCIESTLTQPYSQSGQNI